MSKTISVDVELILEVEVSDDASIDELSDIIESEIGDIKTNDFKIKSCFVDDFSTYTN